MELKFRTLTADEIDVRVDQVIDTPKFLGCRVLLYKDARVDMNLLDEVVGCMNWKREHRRENANCVVSIWDDEKREWISKEDTGSESNTEKEKGLASDSFKRACVNWGIGRELYSAPKATFITLSPDDVTRKDGKTYINKNVKFYVKEIDYDEKRNINHLVIVNQAGAIVFEYDEKNASKAKKAPAKPVAQPKAEKPVESPEKPAAAPSNPALTDEQLNQYDELCADLDNADKTSTALAICLMAEGQPYELSIRKKAAMRGIELAMSKAEVKDAYELIKGLEGWQEAKAFAQKTVVDKHL